jgi:hypothetical protein
MVRLVQTWASRASCGGRPTPCGPIWPVLQVTLSRPGVGGNAGAAPSAPGIGRNNHPLSNALLIYRLVRAIGSLARRAIETRPRLCLLKLCPACSRQLGQITPKYVADIRITYLHFSDRRNEVWIAKSVLKSITIKSVTLA